MKFATPDAFRIWLEAEHANHPDGVFVEYARAKSGIPSIKHKEAVVVALTYGWIDGQAAKKSDDDDPNYWRVRFTPRRKRSIWSKVNRTTAEELIATGAMHPAGLAEVDRAKADGRWDAAYDSPSTSTVPDDLQTALDANPAAAEFFKTLKSNNRYAILHRVQTAKKPETRVRRIEKFVDMLARGETIY